MDYSRVFLNKRVTVKIDRPLGSKHPKWGFVYLVNYGYIQNTKAPDGEGIDAYVLGVFEPIMEFSGICIAIIERSNDNDDKLIIVPEGVKYSNRQIEDLIEFQEKYFTYKIIT